MYVLPTQRDLLNKRHSDTKFWYTFAEILVLFKLVIIVVLKEKKKKNRREKIRHENYAYFNDYVAKDMWKPKRKIFNKKKKKMLYISQLYLAHEEVS